MKVTISASFDPFTIAPKTVMDALLGTGLLPENITTGRSREKAKEAKPAKVAK